MLKYIPKKKLLLLAGDIILIYCAYLLSPIIRFRVFFFEPLEGLGGFSIILCIYLFCFYIADLYNLDVRFKAPRYIFNFFLANVFSAGLGLFMFFFFSFIGFGRGIFAITVLTILFFTYTWRIFFELVFAKFLKRKQAIIIVGAGKAGKEIYKSY